MNNLSPYATWRTSPMGLGGRDPIFYAQLASETETFHPEGSELTQDICLGCHGILGQRQYAIDQLRRDGRCGDVPAGARQRGALARRQSDGAERPPTERSPATASPARPAITCWWAGRRRPSPPPSPRTGCVKQRQELLNPDNHGFARTFTGSFLVGPPDRALRPLRGAQGQADGPGPRDRAGSTERRQPLGDVRHLPHRPPAGPAQGRDRRLHLRADDLSGVGLQRLPHRRRRRTGRARRRRATRAESCQGCHMPSKDAAGRPTGARSPASRSTPTSPQAEYNLRAGGHRPARCARASLATRWSASTSSSSRWRSSSPTSSASAPRTRCWSRKGLDPLLFTERAMLDQAALRPRPVIAIGRGRRRRGACGRRSR